MTRRARVPREGGILSWNPARQPPNHPVDAEPGGPAGAGLIAAALLVSVATQAAGAPPTALTALRAESAGERG